MAEPVSDHSFTDSHQDFLSFYPKFLRAELTGELCSSAPSLPAKKQPLVSYPASALQQNFYHNLLSFSCQRDSLVAALSERLTIIKKNSAPVFLSHKFSQPVSSIACHEKNPIAAVGCVSGGLNITDLSCFGTLVRRFDCRGDKRVGVIDWRGDLLIVGDRAGRISFYDARSCGKIIAPLKAHGEEICAAKFSPFDDYLFATGGNDNQFKVFDLRTFRPISESRFHRAAVKALTWHPDRRGRLFSGGGTGDHRLAVWDVTRNLKLKSKDIGSQLCNIGFDAKRQIVCTFGWSSNEVQIRNSQLRKVAVLYGHRDRVLYMAINSDRTLLATGSSDHTIKIWDLVDETIVEDFGFVSQLGMIR